MNTTEDTGDKLTPPRNPLASISPATLLAVLIIAIQIIVSIATYPFMPDSVPSHWDAAGQVNGYLPKLVNALLYPLLSIGIYALVRILMRVGPRLGHQKSAACFIRYSQLDPGWCALVHAHRAIDDHRCCPWCSHRFAVCTVFINLHTLHIPGKLYGQATTQLLGRHSYTLDAYE